MEFNISKFRFKNTKNLKLVAVESYWESQILANNFIINSSLFGPFSEFYRIRSWKVMTFRYNNYYV